jgi:hypothetical protein
MASASPIRLVVCVMIVPPGSCGSALGLSPPAPRWPLALDRGDEARLDVLGWRRRAADFDGRQNAAARQRCLFLHFTMSGWLVFRLTAA